MSNSGSWIQNWKTDVFEVTNTTDSDWARHDAAYDPPAPLRTFYVAPNGDDTKAGTSRESALQSLEAALAKLTQAGDHLYVSPGYYPATKQPASAKNAVFEPASGGTSTNPVVIRKNPDESGRVVIGPDREITQGFIIGAYTSDNSKQYVWWMDLEIIGSELAAKGVGFWNCDYNRLIRCKAYGYRGYGTQCSPIVVQQSRGSHVYGCDTYDVKDPGGSVGRQPGISVLGSLEIEISYCEIKDSTFGIFESKGEKHSALTATQGCLNNNFHHNYFHDLLLEAYRPQSKIDNIVSGTDFHFNIVYENRGHTGGWHDDENTDLISYYNNTIVLTSGLAATMTPVKGLDTDYYNNLLWADSTWDLVAFEGGILNFRDYNAFKSTGKISLNGGNTSSSPNANSLVSIANPFVDLTARDFRIVTGHAILGAGSGGANIGATDVETAQAWQWW